MPTTKTHTVVLTNQKGGSAKTSTTVSLGAVLAESGKKVLVVDMDPQANATSSLGVEPNVGGIISVLVEEKTLEEAAVSTSVEGLDVVPSYVKLTNAQRHLAGEAGAEMILRGAIAKAPSGRWDYILIDTPPGLAFLSVSALAAADRLLVPVAAEYLAVRGVVDLLSTVELTRKRLNSGLAVSGYLVCRFDTRTRHSSEIEHQLRESFGDDVYTTVIRECVKLKECPSFAEPITVYGPKSNGAQDYRSFGSEFLEREAKINV